MSLPNVKPSLYTLRNPRNSPDKIFQAHGHDDKIKATSHHNVAHLQSISNDPTKYQLPALFGFKDSVSGQDFKGQGHYSKVKG